MREIKFRAWEKPNGSVGFEGKMHYDIDEYFHKWHGHIDYEVMQFTGLKDKNGIEIYEGDIIGYWGGNPNGAKWIVGWDENKSGWAAVYGEDERTCSGVSIAHMPAFKLSKNLCLKKEIIGNIYESKHLLDNTKW